MRDALTELLPRKARLVIYVFVGTLLLVFSALEAANGNWVLFVVTLAGSLQSVLAVGNLTPDDYQAQHAGEVENG